MILNFFHGLYFGWPTGPQRKILVTKLFFFMVFILAGPLAHREKFWLQLFFFMVFIVAGPLAHWPTREEKNCNCFFHGLHFGWPTGPLTHKIILKSFEIDFSSWSLFWLAHWPIVPSQK